jgi:hypothetical protein
MQFEIVAKIITEKVHDIMKPTEQLKTIAPVK